MIDIKLLRENPSLVKKKVTSRSVKIDFDKILKLDKEQRALLKKLEDLRALKNKATEKIAKAEAKDKKSLITEMKKSDKDTAQLETDVKKLTKDLDALLRQIPNLPLDGVPVGKDETANEEMRKFGKPPKFDFTPRDHLELGETLDVIDVKRAAKSAGTRFGILKGAAALLEFALIQYALDLLKDHNFTPVIPPVFLNAESMGAMGYLEHGGDKEIYHLPKDDLYLIGTSEQAIGPMHAKEILCEEDLPLRYLGFSPCFRREAGAYGKDTRGIFRVHQFDKLEMFAFTHPDKSSDENDFMLALQEKFMQGLELPYRVMKLSTGDIGAPSARTYDIETWFPSQKRYRETHSTSTCTDFQARRLKTRFKTKEGKNELVHTCNGTVFAGRVIIAILENFQQKDGSVLIPKALRQFLPIDKIKAL